MNMAILTRTMTITSTMSLVQRDSIMKKVIIIVWCLALTACSVDLGSDLKADNFVIDGQVVEIAFSDDNTNENIIIKSDQKDYFNPFGNFSFYFTVENLTGESQNIDVIFFLNEGEVLNIYQHDGTSEEVVEEIQPTATSSERLGAELKRKTKWKNINIKQATKKRPQSVKMSAGKMLGAMEQISVKSVDDKSANKTFTVYMADKEKLVFKGEMSKKNYEDENEFFIEAYGASSGYGQLDPWAFAESFDSLNDGNLATQNNWTSANDTFTVGADYKFAGAKGLRGNGSGSYIQDITSVTSGTFYFASKVVTQGSSGDGFFVQLRRSTSYCPTVKWYTGAGSSLDFGAFTNAGSYTFPFTGLSTDTWYIFAIEFDASQNYKMKYKTAGGSWSSWSSTYKTYSNCSAGVTRFRIGQDAGWVVYFDEVSDEDPDSTPPPTPSTAPTPAQDIIWFD
jgi:hypothetical protein